MQIRQFWNNLILFHGSLSGLLFIFKIWRYSFYTFVCVWLLVKYFKTNANAPILDSIIYCSVHSYFEKCILWGFNFWYFPHQLFFLLLLYLFLFMREALNFHFCLTVTISWETNWPWMMAITISFSQLCNYAFYLCIIFTCQFVICIRL